MHPYRDAFQIEETIRMYQGMKTSFIKRQILYILTAIFFACNPAYLSAQQSYIDPQTGIHFIDRVKPDESGHGPIRNSDKIQSNYIRNINTGIGNRTNSLPGMLKPGGVVVDWTKNIGADEQYTFWSASDMAVDQLNHLYVLHNEINLPDGSDFLLTKYDPDGNQIWQDKYNGIINGDDRGLKLYVDSENNIIS